MRNIAFRTLEGSYCDKEQAVFDLVIARSARRPLPSILPATILAANEACALGQVRQPWVRLRTSFDSARECVKLLAGSGGRGVLVPSCYADFRISLADAERIANVELDRILAMRKAALGPLVRSGHDELLSWTFFVHDPGRPDGATPDGFFISVDKCDGHIQSEEEIEGWSRLLAG